MEAKLIRLRKLRREWHWFNDILEVKYMMSLGWPVASQWCFCSPWMRSGQSPVWRCSWQRVSSWGCSSAQHYWTWQTGCSPDCLNPLGWRWLCSLLGNKQKKQQDILMERQYRYGTVGEARASYPRLTALWCRPQPMPSGQGWASYSGRPWTLPEAVEQILADGSARQAEGKR